MATKTKPRTAAEAAPAAKQLPAKKTKTAAPAPAPALSKAAVKAPAPKPTKAPAKVVTKAAIEAAVSKPTPAVTKTASKKTVSPAAAEKPASKVTVKAPSKVVAKPAASKTAVARPSKAPVEVSAEASAKPAAKALGKAAAKPAKTTPIKAAPAKAAAKATASTAEKAATKPAAKKLAAPAPDPVAKSAAKSAAKPAGKSAAKPSAKALSETKVAKAPPARKASSAKPVPETAAAPVKAAGVKKASIAKAAPAESEAKPANTTKATKAVKATKKAKEALSAPAPVAASAPEAVAAEASPAPKAKPKVKAAVKAQSQAPAQPVGKSAAAKNVRAQSPAAVKTPAAAPAPAPAAPAPARFTLEGLDARLFGSYRVTAIEGGEQWLLQLRGPRARDLQCSCRAFALSDPAQCEHSHFLLGQLREALAHGWQAEHSELDLSAGPRHQLQWRQSPNCPESLATEVQAVLRGIAQGKLAGAAALSALLQQATEAGHELRVHESVWQHLALAADAAERVRVLGQAYPQLFDSPGLRNLLKLPLPHFQLEAALFAACAGRSLVADDLGLGLYAPALGMAELMLRHFGVERVLLLCAESSQTRWLAEAQSLSGRSASLIWGDAEVRRSQAQGPAAIKIAALNALQQDLTLLQEMAPELIIVDEAQRLDAATLESLRQLDRGGFMLMLSSQLLNKQPQLLLPLVDLLDCHRQGPLADFLAEHVHRDGSGRVTGFMSLGDVDETLERLVFSRTRAELQPNLPLALVQLRSVPLSQAQQTLQQPLLASLRQVIGRWQRSGFISGAEQLQLKRNLQALRRLAISPQLLAEGGEAVGTRPADAPKLIAVAAVARELQGRALDRLWVCSQWDDALALLQPLLQSAGIPQLLIPAALPLAQRRSLAERWLQDSRGAVLLCSDAAAQGLDLQAPGCGLLNLELSWGEALLEQRLSRVADEDTRGLPLIQLQAQSGFEAALLQLQDQRETMPDCGLDGDAGPQLLQGEALVDYMQALVTLLEFLPAA